MENKNSFDKSLVNLVKLFLQTALTGAGMYPSMTHHPEVPRTIIKIKGDLCRIQYNFKGRIRSSRRV